MSRQARIIIPEEAHHVTQRGNNQQRIFDGHNDYQFYCRLINRYKNTCGVAISAYCLMPNHIHLIAIPKKEDSLARLFNKAHTVYAQYLNARRNTSGHIWQGRFYSCAMTPAHLYRAIRYVEQNPVRAGLSKNAWEYYWSSAQQHVTMSTVGNIAIMNIFPDWNEGDWRTYLATDDAGIDTEIRVKTNRGLVVGDEPYIKRLEQRLQRSLECLPIGRPKRKKWDRPI
jgi:putative transposase